MSKSNQAKQQRARERIAQIRAEEARRRRRRLWLACSGAAIVVIGLVVGITLALSGGAGYLNGSPLARAYRDVRAGAFMHPLGDNRAYEFLGQVAFGREPSLH